MSDEEQMNKKGLIKRLYGLKVVYDNLRISYINFYKECINKSENELRGEIKNLERKYEGAPYITPLIGKIYYYILSKGTGGIPLFIDFEETARRMERAELEDLLARITEIPCLRAELYNDRIDIIPVRKLVR